MLALFFVILSPNRCKIRNLWQLLLNLFEPLYLLLVINAEVAKIDKKFIFLKILGIY